MAASALTLVTGCAGKGGKTTSSTDTSTISSSPEHGRSTGSKSQQETKQQTEIVSVGEVVAGENVAMVVRAEDETKRLGESQKALPGHTFRVVEMAVKNTSGKFIKFTSFFQAQLKDGLDRRYDAALIATDHPVQGGYLAPGEVARGNVVFEVPKAASKLEFQLDFSSFNFFDFNRVIVPLGQKAMTIADLTQSLTVEVLAPGTKAAHGDISVVAHDVRTTIHLGSDAKAADGYEYVIPEIEITNNTGTTLPVSPLLQTQVKTETGTTSPPDSNGNSALTHSYTEETAIADNKSHRREIAYIVPSNANPLYWTFAFVTTKTPYKAFWNLH